MYTQRSKQIYLSNDGEEPFETLKNENTHNQSSLLWTKNLKKVDPTEYCSNGMFENNIY